MSKASDSGMAVKPLSFRHRAISRRTPLERPESSDSDSDYGRSFWQTQHDELGLSHGYDL